jgi:hypothetical protein
MPERLFDEGIFIRDFDIDTGETKIYYIPEDVWKSEEFDKTDDPITAPIQPMIAKGAILAAVPEVNPQGVNCYLVNLAELWVNHDPRYARNAPAAGPDAPSETFARTVARKPRKRAVGKKAGKRAGKTKGRRP